MQVMKESGLTERDTIQLLAFDMGHVFVDFEWDEVCRGFCSRSGATAEKFAELLLHLGSLGYEKGSIATDDFLQELNQGLSADISKTEFRDLWTATFRTNERMIELFHNLLSKDYTLYLLSNTNDVHFSFIESNFNISRHFHKLILSYEIGSMKPEEEIYREVFRLSGRKPSECLFVDDLEANVKAAEGLGMNTIQFRGVEPLLEELSTLGIINGAV